MRLRPVSIAAAFILLLVLAWTAWWSSAAWALRRGIDGWAEAQRAAGATVGWTEFRLDGFPLELAVSARDLTWRDPGGTAVTLAGITAAADAWDPWTIRLTALDNPVVTLPGLPPLAAEGGHGLVQAGTVGVDAAEITLTAARLPADGTGTPLTAGTVRLAMTAPPAPPQGHTDPLATVTLDLSDLTLPAAPAAPLDALLGARLPRAALTATVLGPLPPGPTTQDIRTWSRSGGTVELSGLMLDWGELSVRGDGTLALDGDLQPQLAGTIQVGGLAPLLEALAEAGALTPEQARRLRPLAELLSQPREDGVPRASLPVTVQDRTLSIGPARLFTLPRLTW